MGKYSSLYSRQSNGLESLTEEHPWASEPQPWRACPGGDHSETECHYFYRTVRAIGGNCLNLGVSDGLSVACMAMGLRDSGRQGKVYSVDATLSSKFFNGMTDLGLIEFIEPCGGPTKYWATRLQSERFSFILIDADHSYDSCKQDWELYSPLTEGLIALHDANFFAVGKVIDEIDLDVWWQVEHIWRLKVYGRR